MKGPATIAHEELAEKYRWKAENIVRFSAGLGMTTKQKEDFLASELAHVHESAELNILVRR